MLIAQLANFHSPTSGGLRSALDALAAGYEEAGVGSLLIVPGKADDDRRAGHRRIVTVASPKLPRSGGYRMITDLGAVRSVLHESAPDRLEVSDKTSLARLGPWARASGVPSVLLSHERIDAMLGARLPSARTVQRLADRRNRTLVRRFDIIVCCSAYNRAELDRVGATNTCTIPLGVDLDRFHPAPVRDGGDEVVLVTVGRLSAEKQPALAIDVVAELRRTGTPARLVVVGTGPLEAQLRRRAAGLPVTFTGHLHHREELVSILRSATVALQPCPIESFGLAVLEAMACGTPAVVPAAGAAPELVGPSGRAGVVCAPTVEGLADGMRRVLRIPEEHRRAGARTRAERYPWSATVERLLEVHGCQRPLVGSVHR